MICNIIIWEECRHLDHKTYDDLPLREKIRLSFVSQGISLKAPAGMHLHLQAMSTKHSVDRNVKAILLTTVTLILEVPISIEKFSLLFLLTYLKVLIRRFSLSTK